MPNFNLKGDAPKTTPQGTEQPVGKTPSGGLVKTLLIVFGVIVVLALGIFFLNKSGVVHLWGKKAPAQTFVVTEQLPDTFAVPSSVDTAALAQSAKKLGPAVRETKKKSESMKSKIADAKPKIKTATAPTPSVATTSGGAFSVQLSSWATVEKANLEVELLKQKGLPAFVHGTYVSGFGQRYRVNVGRYASAEAAHMEARKFSAIGEGSYLVIRLGK
jgi:cell division septation protein DedD